MDTPRESKTAPHSVVATSTLGRQVFSGVTEKSVSEAVADYIGFCRSLSDPRHAIVVHDRTNDHKPS
jgi:hypothetical protein